MTNKTTEEIKDPLYEKLDSMKENFNRGLIGNGNIMKRWLKESHVTKKIDPLRSNDTKILDELIYLQTEHIKSYFGNNYCNLDAICYLTWSFSNLIALEYKDCFDSLIENYKNREKYTESDDESIRQAKEKLTKDSECLLDGIRQTFNFCIKLHLLYADTEVRFDDDNDE